jgi:hypothetical protein
VPALELSPTYGGGRPAVVPAVLGALAAGVGVGIVSRPWIGVVAGVATLVGVLVPKLRIVLAVAIPLSLVASRAAPDDEIAWLTIGLLVVDLAVRWLRDHVRAPARMPPGVSAG